MGGMFKRFGKIKMRLCVIQIGDGGDDILI